MIEVTEERRKWLEGVIATAQAELDGKGPGQSRLLPHSIGWDRRYDTNGFLTEREYRPTPQPFYRPFTQDEAASRIGRRIRVNSVTTCYGSLMGVNLVSGKGICVSVKWDSQESPVNYLLAETPLILLFADTNKPFGMLTDG